MIRTTAVAIRRALVEPSHEELASFVREARLETGQRGIKEDERIEWRNRKHRSSNLLYTIQSIGYKGKAENEAVSLGQRPIWTSSSLGGIIDLCTLTDIAVVRALLQGRALRLEKGQPPKDGYRFKGFRYVYREHGTLAEGYGEEQLFHDIYLVYQTHFRHRFIR